jgi:hypothetical protein
LPGLIVKLARDAPPLVFLRAQQLARHLLQLGVARRHRAAFVAEHQEQGAERHRYDQQHVREHAVQHAMAERAQQRVIEMMEPPQQERPRQHGGAARRHALAMAREHQAGPQRDGGQQHGGRQSGRAHVVDLEDGDRGPADRRDREPGVAPAPPQAARELKRGREQQQRHEQRRRLVDEQPHVVAVLEVE